MSQTATAIYENGVLRLLSPLDLPEHARVRVEVQPEDASEDPEDQRQQVRRILIAEGLISPDPPTPRGAPLSEQELEELAERISGAGPLSDLIIEERREGP